RHGRLGGVIWPMTATQVAQSAAVAAGLTVVLWLARLLSGRVTLVGVTFAVAILLLTYTRTAMVGLVAGILVAGLSLFTINARVRKLFAAGGAAGSRGGLAPARAGVTYLARRPHTPRPARLTAPAPLFALRF